MITIKDAKILYGESLEVRKANIIIEDDIIVEVSENIEKGKIIDGKNCIVAPSLINSHVHIGDSVAKDVGDGETIDKIVKPPDGLKHRILANTSTQDLMRYMRITMDDMLQTGTTTFVDFREGGFGGIDSLDKASINVPITKIVLGRHESFMNPDKKWSELVKITENLLKSCEGIGLSGFGEISDESASAVIEACRKNSKISSIHVAEYEKLQTTSLELYGETEVSRALKLGFDLLVHLTSPLKNDLEIVGESNTSVVACPRSNGALGVGIPPLKDMLDNNINVLLGTDNVMFNSPNMFREMEYALKVTRGFYKQYISPVEIFKMATVNPSKALKLNTGVIQEGRTADIMIINGMSSNPILSLINRTESQNIKTLIKEGNIVFER